MSNPQIPASKNADANPNLAHENDPLQGSYAE